MRRRSKGRRASGPRGKLRSLANLAARARPWLLRLTLAGALTFVVVVAVLWGYAEVDRAHFVRPEGSVTVTDRHGEPLRETRPEGFDRRWVELDEVSPHLIDAVLSVEDERFRQHWGVDLIAVCRAAIFNLIPGHRLSGASTITQQLIKLTYGRPHGLWSKPVEVLRAVRLERIFTKDEILEQYLNRLPYGDQIVGVGRASEQYFGKPASELTVAEAALLAGIPQAPSITEPRRHLPRALARRRIVLRRMLETGRIDRETYELALAEEPAIHQRSPRPWRAPRFAEAALDAWRRGELRRRDGELRTSLDLSLQRRAERVLRGGVEELEPRGVRNGAAVVVANSTGEVLAYVGAARRGPDEPGGQLDLLRASRQPGSALKPLVYELLFERGATAATLLDDSSRPMTGGGDEIFEARNYDGDELGTVRAREALAASLNLAALDAAARVGARRIVPRLRELGLNGLRDPEHHGAAIVLGGAEVTPLELAAAYLTLARGGTRLPLTYGEPSEEGPVRVMDEGAALVVIDILRDRRARSEAFGDDLMELLGGPELELGLKTGTSTGWHDAWAAVFTEQVTVVVWLGDPQGRPLGGVSGFEGAAPLAVRIAGHAHRRAVALGLRPPEGGEVELAAATVCGVTGLLPGPECGHLIRERFVPGTLPSRRCPGHERRVLAALVEGADPTEILPDRGPSPSWMAPQIVHPSPGARLLVRDDQAQIPLRATVTGLEAPEVMWEVDGAPIPTRWWTPTAGRHQIAAVWRGRRSEAVEVEVVGGL